MRNEKIKRLIIELPVAMHNEIKIKAALRNISMRLWVTRIIIEALRKEEEYEKKYT